MLTVEEERSQKCSSNLKKVMGESLSTHLKVNLKMINYLMIS